MKLSYALFFTVLLSVSSLTHCKRCTNSPSDESVIRRVRRNVDTKFTGRPLADHSSEEDSSEEKCPTSANLWKEFVQGLTDNSDRWSSWRFQNVFSARGGQWLFGPNVCKNVQEKRSELKDGRKFEGDMYAIKKVCRHTDKSYECLVSTVENDTEVTRITTYECCLGFQRSNRANGCPDRVDLKPLKETLQSLNLTRFLKALEEVGLEKILDGTANYTIFAPTNEAFENPPASDDINVVQLEDGGESKFAKDVLSAHIVEGWHNLDSVEDEQSLPTLKQSSNIQTVFYNYPRPMAFANCAKITLADKQTTNGYIQVVDRSLPQASKTLLALLQEDSSLSTFSSLLNEDLKKSLNDENKRYTVFAFTDQSFETLPPDVEERFKIKSTCVADVTRHHITPITICSAILDGFVSVRSISNRNLLLNASTPNNIQINGKNVISKDRMATNGVLYVIDGVMLFPHNQDILSALDSMGYGQMASLLKHNKTIEQKLSGSNETTLFLPPLRAVRAILASNITDEEKSKRLANHLAERLNDQKVRTFAGQEFDTGSAESGFFLFSTSTETVGCAKVVDRVADSCNGVIKLIDGTLPILTESVADVIRKTSEFSDFNELLNSSGLDKDLLAKPEKMLTVFVPTNQAMRSMSKETRDDLLNDQEKLNKFIRQYVVNERLCCHRLTSSNWFDDGRSFESDAGTALQVSKSNGRLSIDGAPILRCNFEASNGVVHAVGRRFVRRRRWPFADNGFFGSFFKDF